MHSSNYEPKLVILDLNDFLGNQDFPLNNETVTKICLLISCLLNYINNIDEKIVSHCISITYIKENDITKELLSKLIELYFYKTTFTNLTDIKGNFDN